MAPTIPRHVNEWWAEPTLRDLLQNGDGVGVIAPT